MRIVTLSILPLVALAACATPREACIAGANSQGRVLNQLVNETRANIRRGYAIEVVQEFVEVDKPCVIGDVPALCPTLEPVDVQKPVAIDLDAEMAKLRSLEARQQQNQAQANAAIQQCIAIHPE